jgi:hypothetical protein
MDNMPLISIKLNMKKVKTYIIPFSIAITFFLSGYYFKDINKIFDGIYNSKEFNNPTWTYGPTISDRRQLIINFDKSKIESLLINGRPLELTLLKLNSNNKPAINISINYEISTIQLTDIYNRKYKLTKK